MFLKNRAILIFILSFDFFSGVKAQFEDSTSRTIDTVHVSGKKWNFKIKNLYDENSEVEKPNIHGFYALNIFNGQIDKQIWISNEKKCIESKLDHTKNGNYLHLNWDKISGGCDWIGMGFGWDNWKPKDLSAIIDSAYILIEFNSPSDIKNIPVAFALEDYSGSQAYQGFNSTMLTDSKILANKTNFVRIPLYNFPFKNTDTDASNIKQFMIQFEADGMLNIKKISITQ